MRPEELRAHIADANAGDTESFRKLYEHLVDRVYAYLRSRTSTKEQATDLAQEVFTELWQALPRFTYHSREQFYAYVFIIAKRKLIKLYGQKSRASIELNEETMSPVTDGKAHESNDMLMRALSILDPQTREIITLHHWSRYTFGEIATLVNMTESAVRVRHHRALKTLHEHLRQSYHA